MAGAKSSAAGGRVLEYRRSHKSSRPYAVRVMLQSTPRIDMRHFDGRWGTLQDTMRKDGLWHIKVDEDGGPDGVMPLGPQESILVHPENVVRKLVLSEPILVYDMRQASMNRFAFHV